MPHNWAAEAFSRYEKGLDKFMENRSINSSRKRESSEVLTSLIEQLGSGGVEGKCLAKSHQVWVFSLSFISSCH